MIFSLLECFRLLYSGGIIIEGMILCKYQNQGTAGTIQLNSGGACEEGRGQAGDDRVYREGEVQPVAQAGLRCRKGSGDDD